MYQLFQIFSCALILLNSNHFIRSLPISEEVIDKNLKNDTDKDLLIIRTIVYEVGILTDEDENATSTSESDEEIDLTFYNSKHNGSLYNLSNIPIPIQTNYSGTTLTGIVPINFGELDATNSSNFILKSPIFPSVLFGSLHNVSTSEPNEEKQIITKIKHVINNNDTYTKDEEERAIHDELLLD